MGENIRPDDIRRAPSGRVPQWVLDEARGIQTQPVPFRAHTPPAAGLRRKKRWRDGLILIMIVGLVAAYGVYSYNRDATTIAAVQRQVTRRLDAPTPGHEEGKHRVLPASPAGTSTRYRILAHQRDRITLVTWSPCRPIHYVVRADYAPPGGAGLLDEGFSRLSAATGLQFVNDGATSEAPADDRPDFQPKAYGDRWAPVLVVWATPDEVPDFGVDVAGEARPRDAYTATGAMTYVSGEVSFDARKFANYVQTADGLTFARSVILHELGHLAGLDHVNDPTQVMSPHGGPDSYGEGDKAGLALLGKGPCQPSV